MTYLVAVLAIAVGVSRHSSRGIDDSPGAQLMGLLIFIGTVVLGVRHFRRSR